MTTYSIKAPDGNTYDIDGPDGATDEQVRSRVLAAHPNAAKPSAARAAQDAEDAKIRAQGGLSGDEGFLTNVAMGLGKSASDMGLGLRQAAASIPVVGKYLGDKEALNAEAADREKRDAALMGTGGGMVGKYGLDLASSFIPMGVAAKIGTGAGMIPALGRAAGTGAAMGLATPDKDYSALEQGGYGALFGAGGDLVGRGVGRVLKPMQDKAIPIVQEHLKELSGMPSLLAENLTDNKFVKMMTNALSQLGPAGGGVNASRARNLEQITEDITRSAGAPTRELTPEKARLMADRLTDQIEAFKAGPRVPLTNFPNALAPALRDVQEVTNIAGGSTAPIRQAMANTQGTPGAVSPFTRPQTGMPIPNYAPIPKNITAEEALRIRSKASDAAYGTDDWTKKEQFLALRDSMDEAIKASHSDKGQAFDKWRAEYGTMKDIQKAGVSPSGNVLPEDFAKQLSKDAQIAPRTPLDRETVAASARMASPSLSENRSLAVRMLMGSLPFAAVGGAGVLGGPLGAGAAAGTLGLAHTLLGTPAGGRYLTGQASSKLGKALQSEKTLEMLRQLGLAGATTVGE